MSDAALARAGRLGDGWLANALEDEDDALRSKALVLAHAESAGKDPDAFGLQMMLDVPPRDDAGRMFYRDWIASKRVRSKSKVGVFNTDRLMRLRSSNPVLDL